MWKLFLGRLEPSYRRNDHDLNESWCQIVQHGERTCRFDCLATSKNDRGEGASNIFPGDRAILTGRRMNERGKELLEMGAQCRSHRVKTEWRPQVRSLSPPPTATFPFHTAAAMATDRLAALRVFSPFLSSCNLRAQLTYFQRPNDSRTQPRTATS